MAKSAKTAIRQKRFDFPQAQEIIQKGLVLDTITQWGTVPPPGMSAEQYRRRHLNHVLSVLEQWRGHLIDSGAATALATRLAYRARCHKTNLWPETDPGIKDRQYKGEHGPLVEKHIQDDRTYTPEDALKIIEDVRARILAELEPGKLLRIDGRSVYVNEELVPLNMTPEASEEAIAFLGELLKEPGNWQSGPDIGKATDRESTRFDLVFKKLPERIKSMIESNRRKGYRLRK